ncbi:MAG: EAL domain-containing protein [Rhodocyclaceae bacterium]|nr:EAL domain-containing protein [Rhodocyclaceae bacterium]
MNAPAIPARVRARLQGLAAAPQAQQPLWRSAADTVVGNYHGARLTSAFQPIVNLASGRLIGHQALLRFHTPDGPDAAPWNLFQRAAGDAELVALDRLARSLHTLNYYRNAGATGTLFVHVHGRLLGAVREDHGATFRRMLGDLGLANRNIVIELPAVAMADPGWCLQVLANYRRNGFAVAANAGDAEEFEWLDRQARPHYLKLDIRGQRARGRLARLVTAAARRGVATVFKCVETQSDLEAARAPGCAYAQGYALGAPAAGIAYPAGSGAEAG